MTTPNAQPSDLNPTAVNPNTAPKGNAAIDYDAKGITLQRGGEEIALEKLDDRFTVTAITKDQVPGLATQVEAQVSDSRLPKMSEFVVQPSDRDAAMKTIRQSDMVQYASHVYSFKDDPSSRVYLTNRLTIQFVATLKADAMEAITKPLGLTQIKEILGVPNAYVYELAATADENPVKVANTLMQRPDVLTAEPNIVIPTQSHYRPKDSQYINQWHLNHNQNNSEIKPGSHVFAEQAWDVTRGARSVIVAVADDGMDLKHPDFQGIGKIVSPRDFKGKDYLPMPEDADENHGTSCAGVAIAEENGVGCVGAAPGCALMPIRTTGYLDDESIEDLLDWVITRKAAVLSCSWGPSAVYFPLSLRQKAAITRAATQGRRGKGCVIVFAAGNANRPTEGTINESGWDKNAISGPTKWLGGFTVHPDVITVSACTSLNTKAAYSNWGPQISVCAPSNNAPPGVGLPDLGYVATPPEVTVYLPGLGIATTDRTGADGYDPSDYTPNSGPASFGGTSSACPLVAGVAALVISANPQLTAREVRQVLEQSADKIVDNTPDPQLGFKKGSYENGGRSDWFGAGKVNAAKAVQMAVQMRSVQASLNSSRSTTGLYNQIQSIPDGSPQGLVTSVKISDAGSLQDITVAVDIDHAYLGDIEITLITPRGDRVLLQGRTLGIRTKLQVTYTLSTTPSLRLLLGAATQGTWQLEILDRIPGDTGKLNWWQLKIGI